MTDGRKAGANAAQPVRTVLRIMLIAFMLIAMDDAITATGIIGVASFAAMGAARVSTFGIELRE